MTIPPEMVVAAIGVFAVVLAGVLTDIGIWRRGLSRDIRRLTERLAIVETSIHYMSPASYRRAKREVEHDE